MRNGTGSQDGYPAFEEARMAFRLAVAGKGGSGKTTLAGLVVRSLVQRRQGPVLAVDADPNANLGLLLGMEPETTLADVREDANQMGRQAPTGITKPAAIEYALQVGVCEGQGVDLVTMGRPEGPGCYCYVNNLLRAFLEKLAGAYTYVVLDNEAGMEHLSRRTTNNVDLLAIVYEPTVVGITTARRLMELSGQLPVKIGHRVSVANGLPADGLSPELAGRVAEAGLVPDLGIPRDETLYEHSANGRSVFELPEDSPALTAVRAAVDRWEEGRMKAER